MKKLLLNALWFAIAVALMYGVFQDSSIQELQAQLQNLNLFWMLSGLALSIFCHWLRGYRWAMLLSAAGHQLPNNRAFAAVMVNYMVNNFLPRVGEVTRSAVVFKSDNLPVAVGMGGVVTERIIDFFCLFALVGIALVFEFQTLWSYVIQNNANRNFSVSTSLLILTGLAVVGGAIIYLLKDRFLRIPIIRKISGVMEQFLLSALSIFKLKNPILFILISVAIWVGYVTVNYFIMLSLPVTAHLLYYHAILITAMGGIGMVIPSPGGVGSFHFAVMEAFKVFHLGANAAGRTLALVIHTPQYILNSIIGGIAFIWLTQFTTKTKKE